MNSAISGAAQPYDYRSISSMAGSDPLARKRHRNVSERLTDSEDEGAGPDTLARRRHRNDTERLTDSGNEEESRRSSMTADGSGTSKKDEDAIRRLASQRRADIRENFHEELSETAMRKRKQTETLSGDDDSSDDDLLPGKSFEQFQKGFGSGLGSSDSREGELDRQQQQVSASSSGAWQPKSDDRGAALLAKMGYGGGGLGKSGQGRTEPIPLSTQRGRVGLGHQSTQSIGRDLTAKWDSSIEEKSVDEHVLWLEVSGEKRSEIVGKICDEWMVIGKRKEIIDDEDQYCDGEVLRAMLKAKSVFDDLSDRDLREARSRANPYETIGSAFFQNRAAMKVANLDRVFDWLLTKENPSTLERKNPVEVRKQADGTAVTTKEAENCDRKLPLFYFADVCAGPGGFTEYVLWRKAFYNAKGFGFTLVGWFAGKDDFKLERFTASAPEYFEPYYGKHGDGDVMNPENIISLEEVSEL
ncbi:unnamed protein product [Anisakis simplex]|uniref:Cap-specific mRNA (nucleoside-2'-O-)-methyltransferase 1 n=1 Tax=Anisakis simplex TaxID=6269 RepID=A0A0M3K1M5_ANISI|nr:unnamed protein product [Anisakis simplex]